MRRKGLGQGAAEGGLSANLLKLIAVAAMLGDHGAYLFAPGAGNPLGIAVHFVGRITGPVMFFFLAEGYHHTRNASRYTLRLAVCALVSWPCFYYFRNGALPFSASGPEGIAPFGVVYTLLLGFAAIRARHEIRSPILKGVAIVGLVLLSAFGDWALYGVVLPLVFDLFYGDFRRQAAAASLVFLISFVPDTAVLLFQGVAFTLENYSFAIIQAGQFLPLALLGFYRGRLGAGGRAAKWLFYLFYPLHLAVLGVLRWGWPW